MGGPEHRLRILSANVLSSNTRYDALLKLVEHENPDVIVLSEITPRWIEEIAELKNHYPHFRAVPMPITLASPCTASCRWRRLKFCDSARPKFQRSSPVSPLARSPQRSMLSTFCHHRARRIGSIESCARRTGREDSSSAAASRRCRRPEHHKLVAGFQRLRHRDRPSGQSSGLWRPCDISHRSSDRSHSNRSLSDKPSVDRHRPSGWP